MRYVSAVSDPELRAELLTDLSGLVVGSAFLLSSPEQAERILKMCDDAARAIYDDKVKSGHAAEVECVTLEARGFIGFDSLKSMADLPDDVSIVPLYRYFDTPREAIVGACICAPSEIPKTREITFFCGPDRRKTGDYRIFSIHPGPKRQIFPSRYQPEAVRKENRDYWDRHIFLATPNQVIAAKMGMRKNYKDLELEVRDRVFHMTRQIEAALHRWYGTWENVTQVHDMKSLMEGMQHVGDYGMAPDGTVYYYITNSSAQPPNLANRAEVEPHLSNPKRPSIIYANGGEEFFLEGKRHREGGPAVLEPTADGGWIEYWYEQGLISRAPDEGPAKIVYDDRGETVSETSIFRGAEVEQTVLGEAAEPIKALQLALQACMPTLDWWEGSQDFALLRGQIDFAANRQKVPRDKVVRQMQAKDEQVGLRWDFDRTLEQDLGVNDNYEKIVKAVALAASKLIEGSQAMRFVRGDPNIVNAIWGKIMRDTDRVIERSCVIPSREEGLTVGEALITAKAESKKFFQSMGDANKMFSATGR